MTWLEENKKYLEKLYQKYPLLEYQEVSIDGLLLNDDEDFRITRIWLFEKYQFFNKKYFENKLPTLTLNNFEYSYESYYRGETNFKLIKQEKFVYKVLKIKISRFRYYTEKEYCEALLHEMVHILLVQAGNLIDSENHTGSFKNKIKELNKRGWDIPLFAINNRPLTSIAKNKTQVGYLIIYVDSFGKYQSFITNKKNISAIKQYYSTLVCLKLCDMKDFYSFPYIDNFQDNIKKGIMTKELSKEELTKLAKEAEQIFNEAFVRKQEETIPQDILDIANSLKSPIKRIFKNSDGDWEMDFTIY